MFKKNFRKFGLLLAIVVLPISFSTCYAMRSGSNQHRQREFTPEMMSMLFKANLADANVSKGNSEVEYRAWIDKWSAITSYKDLSREQFTNAPIGHLLTRVFYEGLENHPGLHLEDFDQDTQDLIKRADGIYRNQTRK